MALDAAVAGVADNGLLASTLATRLHASPATGAVVVLPPPSTLAGTPAARLWASIMAPTADGSGVGGGGDVAELGRLPGARTFGFDAVYNSAARQADVFRASVSPAVSDVLAGRNAVVMCYGQTGAGKTYTIFGPDVDAARVTAEDASQLGVLPRAMHDLFERLEVRAPEFDFDVELQYMQLYCDAWIDLLAPDAPGGGGGAGFATSGSSGVRPPFAVAGGSTLPRRGRFAAPLSATAPSSSSSGSHPLPPPGSGTHALGATVGAPAAVSRHAARSVRELLALLHAGARRKAVAATRLNDNSSRGHTIVHVTLRRALRGGGAGMLDPALVAAAVSTGGASPAAVVFVSTLTFVDLAGSERVSTSGALGNVTRLAETRFINTSLHSLGRVLSCIATAGIAQGRAAAAEREWGWLGDGSGGGGAGGGAGGGSRTPASFIPWRASKLTHFLSTCLAPPSGAECTLTLILCLSPSDLAANESLSTCIFGARTHAVAEALSGDAATAATLLSDATYRSHIGIAAPRRRAGSADGGGGGSPPMTTYTAVGTAPSTAAPAAGAWDSPSRSHSAAEMDAVIDLQRTQIGALTVQYEALTAAHATLQAQYQALADTAAAAQAASLVSMEAAASSSRRWPPRVSVDDGGGDGDEVGTIDDSLLLLLGGAAGGGGWTPGRGTTSSTTPRPTSRRSASARAASRATRGGLLSSSVEAGAADDTMLPSPLPSHHRSAGTPSALAASAARLHAAAAPGGGARARSGEVESVEAALAAARQRATTLMLPLPPPPQLSPPPPPPAPAEAVPFLVSPVPAPAPAAAYDGSYDALLDASALDMNVTYSAAVLTPALRRAAPHPGGGDPRTPATGRRAPGANATAAATPAAGRSDTGVKAVDSVQAAIVRARDLMHRLANRTTAAPPVASPPLPSGSANTSTSAAADSSDERPRPPLAAAYAAAALRPLTAPPPPAPSAAPPSLPPHPRSAPALTHPLPPPLPPPRAAVTAVSSPGTETSSPSHLPPPPPPEPPLPAATAARGSVTGRAGGRPAPPPVVPGQLLEPDGEEDDDDRLFGSALNSTRLALSQALAAVRTGFGGHPHAAAADDELTNLHSAAILPSATSFLPPVSGLAMREVMAAPGAIASAALAAASAGR